MLAAITLAALFGSRPIAPGACPNVPTATFVATARNCQTLVVTGRVDEASVHIDPAFDERSGASAIALPASGNAALTAFDRNGRVLFTFPFAGTGAFRLVLGMSPTIAHSIVRLVLSANGVSDERSGVPTQAPSAEALATDSGQITIIWNAQVYPAIRVVDAQTGSEVQIVEGQGTFEQASVRSDARRLIVSFSDGVGSFDRTVPVLAR